MSVVSIRYSEIIYLAILYHAVFDDKIILLIQSNESIHLRIKKLDYIHIPVMMSDCPLESQPSTQTSYVVSFRH